MPFARPRLSELSPSALRERAAEYRAMAQTATTTEVRDSLLRIADRLATRATERDQPDLLVAGGELEMPPG